MEAKIVESRINAQIATKISLFQMALSTIPSMGIDPKSTKKAAKAFETTLKDLLNGV